MFSQFRLKKKKSSFGYSRIPKDKDSISSLLGDLPEISAQHYGNRNNHRFLIYWGLTSISICINFILAVLVFTVLQSAGKGNIRSYATGFKTEFAASFESIELVETRFTGSPSFRDNGSIYIPHPDHIRYIGDPRKYPEIDQNWENLVEGRYFRITEVEAFKAFGDGYKEYWDYEAGGYVTGYADTIDNNYAIRRLMNSSSLDLFHTLHCLNHLRRGYYPEIYKDENPQYKDFETIELHRNHCLEHIRQYIMCHGDLTPIPTKYYEKSDKQYVDSDATHTCRNFKKIQWWMLDRWNGQNMVHSTSWNETATTGKHVN